MPRKKETGPSEKKRIGSEYNGQFAKHRFDESSDDSDDDDISTMIQARDDSDSDSEEETFSYKSSKKKPEVMAKSSDKKSKYDSKKQQKQESSPVAQKKAQPQLHATPQHNIKYVVIEPEVDRQCKDKLEKVMNAYSDYSPSIVVTPNWSTGSPGNTASGYTLSVDANAAVDTINFDPARFNYGTTVVKLTGSRFKTGEKVNLETIMGKKDNIVAALNTKIDSSSNTLIKPSIETISDSHVQDAKGWHPSLQEDNGGFVSLDYTLNESSLKKGVRSADFFLRIRTGVTPASEDIYQIIEDTMRDNEGLSNDRKTWKTVFHNKNISSLEGVIDRNRKNLPAVVAEAIGIDVSTINSKITEDEKSISKHYSIEPIAEAVTNTVVFTNTGKALYHRGTTNVQNLKRAVVLNETPIMGAHILFGPNQTRSSPYGSSWSNDSNSLETMSFPTDTGKKIARSNNLQQVESDVQFFTWKNQSHKKINSRIAPDQYRLRDESFIEKEKQLGRKHSWGEIQLTPLITKLSSD